MKKSQIHVEDISNRIGNDQLVFNTYELVDVSAKPLSVCQSGVKMWRSPGWIAGPTAYDHYILHYILDGNGVFYCNGHEYPLHKGDIFLIRPYTQVSYQADLKEPYQYYWVGFNGTETPALLLQSGFTEDHPVIHSVLHEDIISCMKSIASIRSASPSQRLYLIGALYHLFSVLISDHEVAEKKSQQYYYHAVSYIRQNIQAPELNVSSVAAYIGIDRTHLFRIFQMYTQSSVREYILRTRMDEARLFLKNTDFPIERIAEFCGFMDASHFSQVFKRMVGSSPRHYRKAIKN